MRIPSLLIAGFTPILAQAACPTAADMAGGIAFTIDGTEQETYSTFAPGVVASVYESSDGNLLRALLGKGIYLLEFADLEDGKPVPNSRTTFSHIFKPTDMPEPKANAVWVSELTKLEQGSPIRETHDHRFGDLTQITFGRCTYDMIPVEVSYGDELETLDSYAYLPQLGFAIYLAYAHIEDGERSVENYTYSDIRAVGAPAGTGSGKGKKGWIEPHVRTGELGDFGDNRLRLWLLANSQSQGKLMTNSDAKTMTANAVRIAGSWSVAWDLCTLSYDARFLRRRRLHTARGNAFLVDLAQTISLNHGDAFELSDGRLIEVVAAQEDLYEIRGDLLRLAWHIGNRHMPCQIKPDRLLIQRDHVIREMLGQLGAQVAEVVAPFTPEGGAYGHGRTHSHSHGTSHDHEH